MTRKVAFAFAFGIETPDAREWWVTGNATPHAGRLAYVDDADYTFAGFMDEATRETLTEDAWRARYPACPEKDLLSRAFDDAACREAHARRWHDAMDARCEPIGPSRWRDER